LFHFPDGAGGEDAGEVGEWVDDAVAADESARIDDGVTADLGVIADDGAELSQAGGNALFPCGDHDFAAIETDIGKDDAGAKMGLVAEDGVAHIIEVRDFAVIEQNAVLELAGIPEYAAIAHDYIFPYVAAAADLAVFANPRRPFNHGSRFHDGALTDKDVIAHRRLGVHLTMQGGMQVSLEVFCDAGEDGPDRRVGGEEGRVSSMLEVQVISGGEHRKNAQASTLKIQGRIEFQGLKPFLEF
jgi:hypothetical protein